MIRDIHKASIERFFSTISPWEAAYTHSGLSYVAMRRNGVLTLIHGRLFLRSAPSTVPATSFESTRMSAGHYLLTELGMTYRDLILQLGETGRIKTPAGELVLPTDLEEPVTAYFDPFHQEGIAAGNRLPVLTLSGTRRHSYVEQPAIDWELKAASQPFDTLNELLFEHHLGGYRGDAAAIETIATSIAEVVFSSKVEGEVAEPSVYLAKSLDPAQCQIGFRVFLHGKVVARGSLKGIDLSWSEQERSNLGVGRVQIPCGASLHCVASYAGFAQHQGWIADPKNFQNPRRAGLEALDDKLEVLRDYLFEEQRERRDARDFEFGVAWLMWLLGFSVAQTGATARTSDAADIIATTPKGGSVAISGS